MDTGSLVESRIADGQFLLEKLVASGFDVSAAAWVKTASDEKWALYVVSKAVDELGLREAYGKANAVIRQLSDPRVSALNVSLVFTETPVGRHLREIVKRYDGNLPVHKELLRLGDVAALEVYIYQEVEKPPLGQHSLNPQEVVQKVVELMSDTSHVQPAQVALRDGTTFLGIPFALELSGGKVHAKFAIEGFHPPRVCPVEEIRAIGETFLDSSRADVLRYGEAK